MIIIKKILCRSDTILLSLFFENKPIMITSNFFLWDLNFEKIIIGRAEIASLSLVEIMISDFFIFVKLSDNSDYITLIDNASLGFENNG